jgi:glycine/D-amino acid oxidase-like deaminating enzyme
MKYYDYLIVGQGICGSIMALMLSDRNKSLLVIDQGHSVTSSSIAAGIVNPVTGKNFVKTWMADVIIPFARQYYQALQMNWSAPLIADKLIYRGLDNIEAENKWISRTGDPDYQDYCTEFSSFDEFSPYILPARSYGVVWGGFQVNLPLLLDRTREILQSQGSLQIGSFDHKELRFTGSFFEYKELRAGKIIFCEGFRGENNPFFPDLPFSPSKGEVLFIKIPDADFKNLIKHDQFIAHLYDDIYWVGGGYEWRAENEKPSESAKEKILANLQSMLKVPFEIIDHKAAIRPATKNRRPIILQHKEYPGMYFFNGMGTKGTSLAPYFASLLVRHLEDGNALPTI